MLPANTQLIPLTIDDQPRVHSLMTELYPPVYARLWTDDCSAYLNRNYGPEAYAIDWGQAGNEYYLVQWRGQDRGILLFNHDKPNPDAPTEKVTYLQKIYLHSTTRGQGLGSALIDWVTAAAEQHGNDAVWLETMTNAASRAVYDHLGFVVTGEFLLDAPHLVPEEAPMLRMQRAIPRYLPQVRKQFSYYRGLGQGTINQLSPEQLVWQPGPASNSIATIIQHLHGNMLSRFTDFLVSDGEKTWRQREQEFDPVTLPLTPSPGTGDPAQIQQLYDTGWDLVEQTIANLDERDLRRTVYIRSLGHTVLEAINRQLAHYAYHIGQIVLLGKLQLGTDWKSLSIPRGESERYNAESHAKGRRGEHYTDQFR